MPVTTILWVIGARVVLLISTLIYYFKFKEKGENGFY